MSHRTAFGRWYSATRLRRHIADVQEELHWWHVGICMQPQSTTVCCSFSRTPRATIGGCLVQTCIRRDPASSQNRPPPLMLSIAEDGRLLWKTSIRHQDFRRAETLLSSETPSYASSLVAGDMRAFHQFGQCGGSRRASEDLRGATSA